MKNLLTLAAYALLAVALPLSFTACGSDDDDNEEAFDQARFNELTYRSRWETDHSNPLFEGDFDHEYVDISSLSLDPLNPSKIDIRVLHEKDHEFIDNWYPAYEGTLKPDRKHPWRGTVTLYNPITGEGVGVWTWQFVGDDDGNYATDYFVLHAPDGRGWSFRLYWVP